MLRALHDSDYCGGIINTDIINKGKLPDTSCPLLVEKEENKRKQVPVVSPPKRVYSEWWDEGVCMYVVCMK